MVLNVEIFLINDYCEFWSYKILLNNAPNKGIDIKEVILNTVFSVRAKVNYIYIVEGFNKFNPLVGNNNPLWRQ